MANKAEQVPTTGNKAGQSPRQTHRRANEKISTTPSKSHDESPRKKATVVVPPTSRKQEREGRNKGSGGATQNKRGRDSEQHTNSRHGRPIHVPGEKGHNRRGHHHKQSAESKNEQTQTSKRGHRSSHGNRKQTNKGEEDAEANPDSGISIEESSSPEIGGLPQEVEKLLLTKTQVKEEEEEEEQVNTRDLPMKDEQGSIKITYSREELMALKDHCLSHVVPKATLPHDVMINSSPQPAKQLQETPGWVAPDQEPAVPEDSQIRHPTTLALIREHDARLMPKVSLSPQRRSFGSGCSWRDAAASASLGKQSTGSTPSGEDVTTPHTEGDSHYPVRGRPLAAVSHSASQQHGSTAPPTPTTPHTPRVIDHVPYLSRQWGGGGGEERVSRSASWRERHVGGSIEEEPEWMEFGPSDRSEVIELCGLEEHEARKEAAKTSPSEKESHRQLEQKEKKQSTIHVDRQSNSSPPDNKHQLPSSSTSSSPHDDFIVDGFDFSTGVSICHELASDSGDDRDDEDEMTISPEKGPQQLGNALMKVLGVSSSKQHHDVSDAQPVRAITLEELEDRTATRISSVNSPKQSSAFDKFLAAMQQNHQSEDRSSHEVLHPSMMQQQHHPPVAPVRASLGVVSSTMMDDPRAAARVAVLNTPFQEAPLPHSKMAMRPFDRVSPMVHRQHMGGEQHGGLLQQQWPPSSSPWPPASTPSYNVPPVGLRQHTHQHHSLMMGSSRSGGSTQPRQASWVMEMEQQRLQMQLREEQQMMREEQMRLLQHQQHLRQQQQQHMSSSPSISLLPTAVIRQMHNAKPKQQMVNEMTRPAQYPSMGSRLEEELSNHMSHSGSYQSMMGHDSGHYSGGGVPLPYHGRTDPLLPQGYPHYRMGTSAMNPTGATY